MMLKTCSRFVHCLGERCACCMISILSKNKMWPLHRRDRLQCAACDQKGIRACQEGENDRAEVVIVFEPEGTSLMMGGLHPRVNKVS